LLLRAQALSIPITIIHNASVMNAIGATGLALYNFGQTVSIPFFTDNWRPDSWLDRVRENGRLGLHTLCLLDIKVKEQSEENLARYNGLRPHSQLAILTPCRCQRAKDL
jgi:diphthine methyl ester synthase